MEFSIPHGIFHTPWNFSYHMDFCYPPIFSMGYGKFHGCPGLSHPWIFPCPMEKFMILCPAFPSPPLPFPPSQVTQVMLNQDHMAQTERDRCGLPALQGRGGGEERGGLELIFIFILQQILTPIAVEINPMNE